ncbi:hypothetical protein EVB27_148 [Rhizobium phage RHph_TM16]|nr:hypothetical protein EVB27_148 [Rhizobium phage RHph_TM16]
MTTVSKRQQILEQIKALFEAVSDNEAAADPFPLKPSPNGVGIGPLSMVDLQKRFTIGIVPGDEIKKDLFPFKEAILPVTVEFKGVKQKGDPDPGVFAEMLLTICQRVCLANMNLGLPDMVFNVSETGNSIDMETFGDKAVAGTLDFIVQYRHSMHDPRA